MYVSDLKKSKNVDFSAVEFIHGNFSEYLKPSSTISGVFEPSASSTADELTKLLLELLKVNGSPLLDISLDISPRNSSKYIGVIRVPGKAAILPRIFNSPKDFAIFKRWVSLQKKSSICSSALRRSF